MKVPCVTIKIEKSIKREEAKKCEGHEEINIIFLRVLYHVFVSSCFKMSCEKTPVFFLYIAFFLYRYIIEMSICSFGGVLFWQESVVVAW
jgi:hypothetical protein